METTAPDTAGHEPATKPSFFCLPCLHRLAFGHVPARQAGATLLPVPACLIPGGLSSPAGGSGSQDFLQAGMQAPVVAFCSCCLWKVYLQACSSGATDNRNGQTPEAGGGAHFGRQALLALPALCHLEKKRLCPMPFFTVLGDRQWVDNTEAGRMVGTVCFWGSGGGRGRQVVSCM